ncbi:hypothetical protein [Acinetobacter proteolyticus]|uniref:hypothetical protein n=1 Tax=Acinetobacter proteolyticus TaxID=1776741 RepID=UPI003D955D16
MSSYSIQVGQIKSLYDIFVETSIAETDPQYPEYKLIGDTFLEYIMTKYSDYHSSKVFEILSNVTETSIANRLKRLESRVKNKNLDMHYLAWNFIERGIIQEKNDYIAVIELNKIYAASKVEYKRIHGEENELTSTIYAEMLKVKPANLRRMLNHNREIVDMKLIERAKQILQQLSSTLPI